MISQGVIDLVAGFAGVMLIIALFLLFLKKLETFNR